MLWITSVGSIIGFLWNLIEFFVERSSYSPDLDVIRGHVIWTLAFLVIGVVSFILLVIIAGWTCEESEVTEGHELVSMRNHSQISGSGSGCLLYVTMSIDTKEVYTYYHKVGDGFKIGKVSADEAIIYENDNHVPQIIETTTREISKCPLLDYVFTFGAAKSEKRAYQIYVPVGSVVQNFKFEA